MPEKAVVLHSGGLDSTVCLLQARSNGRELVSLGIDYGQRHRIELEFARKQCLDLGILRKVLRIEWDKPERPLPLGRSLEEIRSGGISTGFLPGRNLLFLSVACAEASGIGASEVWIGINAVDFSGYPDCRPAFIESYRQTVALAGSGGPQIIAPLLYMSKPEIAREAAKLGLHEGDTWSCYRPAFGGSGIQPCGICDACVLHHHAWSFHATQQ